MQEQANVIDSQLTELKTAVDNMIGDNSSIKTRLQGISQRYQGYLENNPDSTPSVVSFIWMNLTDIIPVILHTLWHWRDSLNLYRYFSNDNYYKELKNSPLNNDFRNHLSQSALNMLPPEGLEKMVQTFQNMDFQSSESFLSKDLFIALESLLQDEQSRNALTGALSEMFGKLTSSRGDWIDIMGKFMEALDSIPERQVNEQSITLRSVLASKANLIEKKIFESCFEVKFNMTDKTYQVFLSKPLGENLAKFGIIQNKGRDDGQFLTDGKDNDGNDKFRVVSEGAISEEYLQNGKLLEENWKAGELSEIANGGVLGLLKPTLARPDGFKQLSLIMEGVKRMSAEDISPMEAASIATNFLNLAEVKEKLSEQSKEVGKMIQIMLPPLMQNPDNSPKFGVNETVLGITEHLVKTPEILKDFMVSLNTGDPALIFSSLKNLAQKNPEALKYIKDNSGEFQEMLVTAIKETFGNSLGDATNGLPQVLTILDDGVEFILSEESLKKDGIFDFIQDQVETSRYMEALQKITSVEGIENFSAGKKVMESIMKDMSPRDMNDLVGHMKSNEGQSLEESIVSFAQTFENQEKQRKYQGLVDKFSKIPGQSNQEKAPVINFIEAVQSQAAMTRIANQIYKAETSDKKYYHFLQSCLEASEPEINLSDKLKDAEMSMVARQRLQDINQQLGETIDRQQLQLLINDYQASDLRERSAHLIQTLEKVALEPLRVPIDWEKMNYLFHDLQNCQSNDDITRTLNKDQYSDISDEIKSAISKGADFPIKLAISAMEQDSVFLKLADGVDGQRGEKDEVRDEIRNLKTRDEINTFIANKGYGCQDKVRQIFAIDDSMAVDKSKVMTNCYQQVHSNFLGQNSMASQITEATKNLMKEDKGQEFIGFSTALTKFVLQDKVFLHVALSGALSGNFDRELIGKAVEKVGRFLTDQNAQINDDAKRQFPEDKAKANNYIERKQQVLSSVLEHYVNEVPEVKRIFSQYLGGYTPLGLVNQFTRDPASLISLGQNIQQNSYLGYASTGLSNIMKIASTAWNLGGAYFSKGKNAMEQVGIKDNLITKLREERHDIVSIKDIIDQVAEVEIQKNTEELKDLKENSPKAKALTDKIAQLEGVKKNVCALDYANFEGVSLNNLDFSNYSFIGATIKDGDLSNSVLKNVSFTNSKFTGSSVDLSGTVIDGETMKTLQPAIIAAQKNGIKVNFANAKLIGDFKDIDLSDLDLSKTDMTKVTSLCDVKKLRNTLMPENDKINVRVYQESAKDIEDARNITMLILLSNKIANAEKVTKEQQKTDRETKLIAAFNAMDNEKQKNFMNLIKEEKFVERFVTHQLTGLLIDKKLDQHQEQLETIIQDISSLTMKEHQILGEIANQVAEKAFGPNPSAARQNEIRSLHDFLQKSLITAKIREAISQRKPEEVVTSVTDIILAKGVTHTMSSYLGTGGKQIQNSEEMKQEIQKYFDQPFILEEREKSAILQIADYMIHPDTGMGNTTLGKDLAQEKLMQHQLSNAFSQALSNYSEPARKKILGIGEQEIIEQSIIESITGVKKVDHGFLYNTTSYNPLEGKGNISLMSLYNGGGKNMELHFSDSVNEEVQKWVESKAATLQLNSLNKGEHSMG